MQAKMETRVYRLVFFLSVAVALLLIGVMLFTPTAGAARGGTARLPATLPTAAEPGDLSPDAKTAPGGTTESARSPLVVELTADKFGELLTAALSDTLPLTQVKVEYPDDRSIRLSGTLSKSDLIALLEQNGDALSEGTAKALGLAPQSMPLTADLGITADSGEIVITPKALTVAGLELPVGLLPASTGEVIGNAAERALGDLGITLQRLEIRDGVLKLYGG